MSFWEKKPLSTSKDITKLSIILERDEILDVIEGDIRKLNEKIKLKYKIVNFQNDEQNEILEFINENYKTSNTNLMLQYSKELIEYFIGKEHVIIKFYTASDKLVGVIVGALKKIWVDGKVVYCIEVDFLCLVSQLRNIHVSSYMISILSRECIFKYDVGLAFFTVGKDISNNKFCTKNYYHKVLNSDIMKEVGLLYESYNVKNSMTKNNNIRIVKTETKEITRKLDEYNKRQYKIFEIKDEDDVERMVENKCIYTFETDDGDNMITIYQLDTLNTSNNKKCRNGYIYCCYFKNNDKEYINDIIDKVCKYCYKEDIFDMITIVDFKSDDKEFEYKGFIQGTGSLNYYMYNAEIFKMNPKDNGLVTI